jgi:hypothetical protein
MDNYSMSPLICVKEEEDKLYSQLSDMMELFRSESKSEIEYFGDADAEESDFTTLVTIKAEMGEASPKPGPSRALQREPEGQKRKAIEKASPESKKVT